VLTTYDEEERNEWAVDIVHHINTGYEPIAAASVPEQSSSSTSRGTQSDRAMWESFLSQDDMFDRVIELELTAAMQSKSANAYESTIKFLHAAAQLLQQHSIPIVDPPSAPSDFLRVDGSCWSSSYPSCVRIYREWSNTLFLMSNFPGAQQCVEYALEFMSPEDRATLFDLHIQSLTCQFLMPTALEVGLAHLKELGVELVPSMTDELRAWTTTFVDPCDESTFHQHPVFALEEMADHHAMDILTALTSVAYFLHSPLFEPLVLTMLDRSKMYGRTPHTAVAFALYAICLFTSCEVFDRHAAVHYALGKMSLLLLDYYGESARYMRPRTANVVYGCIHSWHRPMRESVRHLTAALEEGWRLHDAQWTAPLAMSDHMTPVREREREQGWSGVAWSGSHLSRLRGSPGSLVACVCA
jgi:predicted ATPase